MKVWVQFLLCVLFSASIWLVLNLSQDYVAIVSVPVTARSNIEGRAALSQSEATVTAQVGATGFRHLFLSRKHKRAVQVNFVSADFRHDATPDAHAATDTKNNDTTTDTTPWQRQEDHSQVIVDGRDQTHQPREETAESGRRHLRCALGCGCRHCPMARR